MVPEDTVPKPVIVPLLLCTEAFRTPPPNRIVPELLLVVAAAPLFWMFKAALPLVPAALLSTNVPALTKLSARIEKSPAPTIPGSIMMRPVELFENTAPASESVQEEVAFVGVLNVIVPELTKSPLRNWIVPAFALPAPVPISVLTKRIVPVDALVDAPPEVRVVPVKTTLTCPPEPAEPFVTMNVPVLAN